MKKLYINRTLSAVAVLVWMAVIFLFSAQNGDTSGSTSGNFIEFVAKIFKPDFESLPESQKADIIASWQLVVRKTAHFSEYAVLGGLMANALRTFGMTSTIKWALPCAVCFLYAVCDEVHQYFVPDRACRTLDVLIDTLGGITGTAIFHLLVWLIFRKKARKKGEA